MNDAKCITGNGTPALERMAYVLNADKLMQRLFEAYVESVFGLNGKDQLDGEAGS